MKKYSMNLMLYTYRLNEQGCCPIYLRVYSDGKVSYKSTGHFINEKMWDERNERVKSGHPSADIINAHITFTKMEWQKKLVSLQIQGRNFSPAKLKESFKTDLHNIFEFVEKLIVKSNGKKSDPTLENYRKHLKKLEKYNGSRTLAFEKIDISFLEGYEAWLRENINFRKTDAQKNYIHAIWKTLKTWFNAAKREGLITEYPFDKYENPVYAAPDKDYLTIDELKLFEDFADTTTNRVYKECAVYFLFGCYSGLRISDWYQFNFSKHIKGEKLRLRPAKTKHKWVEMIISNPLKRNLARMKDVKLSLQEPTINEKLKVIATELKINKHLTTHTGRHSFAVTVCLGNKISSETAAELMGITLDTFVKNYSQVTQSKIDQETAEAWKGLE